MDEATKQSKGYAFVEYENAEQARAAQVRLDRTRSWTGAAAGWAAAAAASGGRRANAEVGMCCARAAPPPTPSPRHPFNPVTLQSCAPPCRPRSTATSWTSSTSLRPAPLTSLSAWTRWVGGLLLQSRVSVHGIMARCCWGQQGPRPRARQQRRRRRGRPRSADSSAACRRFVLALLQTVPQVPEQYEEPGERTFTPGEDLQVCFISVLRCAVLRCAALQSQAGPRRPRSCCARALRPPPAAAGLCPSSPLPCLVASPTGVAV